MSDIFISLLAAHLIADWFLQTEWMALNKAKLFHRAGIIHAGIHALCTAVALASLSLPLVWALVIGIVHYAIDLRVLLIWWRKTFKQTTTGDFALHVAVWQDQAAHVLVIYVVALILK